MLPKSLSQLSGPEYIEFKSKTRTEAVVKAIFWIPAISLYLGTYVFLAYLLVTKLPKDWDFCVGAILVYGFFAALGLLAEEDEFLRSLFSRLFNFFYGKTSTYRRTQELRNHFEKIERIVESEAIGILAQIDEAARRRLNQNTRIRSDLNHKKKWRPEYAGLVEIYEDNCNLNSLIVETVSENIKFLKFNNQKKYHFQYLLADLRRNDGRKWLSRKVAMLHAWVPSSRSSTSTKTLNLDDSDDRKRQDTKKQTRPSSGFNITRDDILGKPSSSKVEAQTKERVTAPPSQTTSVRSEKLDPQPVQSGPDDFSLSERPLVEVPRQRELLPKGGRIKISDKLRQQVNEKKIKIGKMGELAVIDYERTRLKDKKSNLIQEIRHVSLTDDSAGYDIQSWNGKEEIFIEVKTTIGDFWSNLFFTQNEFDKMETLAEQYYLYRICNFNLDTGEGNLFIYAGKKLITDSFEFNSKMYLLSEKSH